jgi:hypothetical protein
VRVHTCAAFRDAARSRRLGTPSPPAVAQPQPLWRIELLLDPAPTSRSSSSSMLLSFPSLRSNLLRRGASDKAQMLLGWRRQARTDPRASFRARQWANDPSAIPVRVAPELAGGATGAAPEPWSSSSARSCWASVRTAASAGSSRQSGTFVAEISGCFVVVVVVVVVVVGLGAWNRTTLAGSQKGPAVKSGSGERKAGVP